MDSGFDSDSGGGGFDAWSAGPDSGTAGPGGLTGKELSLIMLAMIPATFALVNIMGALYNWSGDGINKDQLEGLKSIHDTPALVETLIEKRVENKIVFTQNFENVVLKDLKFPLTVPGSDKPIQGIWTLEQYIEKEARKRGLEKSQDKAHQAR